MYDAIEAKNNKTIKWSYSYQLNVIPKANRSLKVGYDVLVVTKCLCWQSGMDFGFSNPNWQASSYFLRHTINKVHDVFVVLSVLPYFSQVQYHWLWLCGRHCVVRHSTLVSFRPRPKPFMRLMEFLLTNFFWLARVVQVRDDEKGHNLSHLFAKKELGNM